MPAIVTGRDEELTRLAALLDQASTSTSRAAVIEGAAGIGKTTLLNAVIAEAASRGFSVFGARAEELEQERSFGTIAEGVRSTDWATDDAVLQGLLGGGSGAEAAFQTVDALVDLIEGRALAAPVMVWFDDLQWADEWTARTVGILQGRLKALPVAIVVGTRPLPRPPEVATALRILLTRGLHVQLAPLEPDAVAELIRHRTGSDPSARLQSALQRAGGNPFFVGELYDALERDGLLLSAGDRVDVALGATPASLLVTVLHRMSSFAEDDLDLIRVAAVLGGSFTVGQLAVAAGRREDELLRPLLRMRDEGTLAEEHDRFRFRHDLLREAVYEDLGGPVRTAMHSRIGHAFADAGFEIVEAAHHFLRGAQPGDTAAADRMIEAANSGRATLSESASLLRRAIEVAPNHPGALQLKERLGSLLQTTDRPAEAIPLLEEVLARTSEASDQLRVVALLGVAALRAGDHEAKRAWNERARQLAAELADSSNPRVLRNVAQCQWNSGHLEEACSTVARAIPLAVAAGDSDAEEEAENMWAWVLAQMGRPQEALPHSLRALGLSPGKPNEAMRLFHQSVVRYWLWEDAAATEALARARAKSEERGAVSVLLKVLCDWAWVDYSAGRWEEAALHADTAVQMMGELGVSTDANDPALLLAWLGFRREEPQSAERWLGETGEAGNLSEWLEMRLALEQGDTAAAAKMARKAVADAPRHTRHRFVENRLPEIARLATTVGDDSLAKDTLQLALDYAAGTSAPSVELTALRCSAIVERDREAAEKAVTLGRASPWRLEVAGALEDAAVVLEDRREELLTTAEGIYEELGSTVDVARLQRTSGRGRRTGRRTSRPVTGWEALTDAERKIVELASEGLTNREIGERLFISHRTAGTHLAHAFDKLQVRSRVELARLAADRASSSS